MKKIGSGTFTKAYLREDGKVVLVSRDPIKEAMSLGFFPDSSYFPKIKFLRDREGPFQEYEMEYLPRPKSLKSSLFSDQWTIYKELKALGSTWSFTGLTVPYYYFWREEFDKIENPYIRDLLKETLDSCSNYGKDIGFEISPRNVSAKDGRLILLDCFYRKELVFNKPKIFPKPI